MICCCCCCCCCCWVLLFRVTVSPIQQFSNFMAFNFPYNSRTQKLKGWPHETTLHAILCATDKVPVSYPNLFKGPFVRAIFKAILGTIFSLRTEIATIYIAVKLEHVQNTCDIAVTCICKIAVKSPAAHHRNLQKNRTKNRRKYRAC